MIIAPTQKFVKNEFAEREDLTIVPFLFKKFSTLFKLAAYIKKKDRSALKRRTYIM